MAPILHANLSKSSHESNQSSAKYVSAQPNGFFFCLLILKDASADMITIFMTKYVGSLQYMDGFLQTTVLLSIMD